MPRPATAAELSRLAEILADAFRDYAWTDWTVPASDRHQRICALQLVYLRHAAQPYGTVWTVEDLTAVAAFVPASIPPLPSKALDQVSTAHGDRLSAWMEAEQMIAEQRPPHDWVLATAGVAPASQGRGLGTAVITAGLEQLDRQGGTCLLETSDPANLALYERLGFTIDAVVATPGPPVWIMTRTN